MWAWYLQSPVILNVCFDPTEPALSKTGRVSEAPTETEKPPLKLTDRAENTGFIDTD